MTDTRRMRRSESAQGLVRALPGSDSGVSRTIRNVADGVFEVSTGRGEAREALAQELRAVSRVDHPHLLPIHDCWTESDALVIMRDQTQRTLESVLRDHHRLPPGAAVTVLTPLASLMHACHSAGVVGVQLSPGAIALSANGAPLATGHGLRQETEHPTAHWQHNARAVAADADAFLKLATSLLDEPSAELTAAVTERAWEKVQNALLSLAAPIPLDSVVVSAAQSEGDVRMRSQLSRVALRSTERRQLQSLVLLQQLLYVLQRLRTTVRPRFWVMGAAGCIAVASVIMLLTVQEPSESAAVAPSVTVESGSHEPSATPVEPSAVHDDDALGAVQALLEQRETCLDAQEEECLIQILMEGSLLYRDDLSGEPSWRMAEGSRVELQQELGDAVIVSVVHEEKPASVLAVNTEAGWLLREVWID